MSIHLSMPVTEYRAIDALNISRLKVVKRSPQHYLHELHHPRETKALRLGTAAHTAVLEPKRYADGYAIWTSRTESGAMSPRRGKAWDEFVDASGFKEILTLDEATLSDAIQIAVRNDNAAMRYLARGDAEVSMVADMHGRKCKGRMDWLTEVDTLPHIVGLKTTRDCRPFVFGKQAAVLGFHMQWAWYHDLYAAAHNGVTPMMKEIVVESAAPHAVAVYHITEDILAQGREDYLALLKTLEECEASGRFPGPCDGETDLSMPSWAYTQSPDDLTDLGLEA